MRHLYLEIGLFIVGVLFIIFSSKLGNALAKSYSFALGKDIETARTLFKYYVVVGGVILLFFSIWSFIKLFIQ